MKQPHGNKNGKQGNFFFFAILMVFLVVFLVSGWKVWDYFSASARQEDRYEELSALVEAAKEDETGTVLELPQTHGSEKTEALTPESGESQTTEVMVLPEYVVLYALNRDTVGWIRIEGTNIDYPVMQSPEEPDFYLDHNFDRQNSRQGCIYAEEACEIFTPSDNITLYGHHMSDGSMFTQLKSYGSRSFWEDHRYIQFDTLTERHTYEIFAVFKTTATVTKGFPYHNFVNAAEEKEFQDFIAQCREYALYETGIVPQYGDKVICLSTCEYSQPNGRLVVAAVRID